MQTTTEPTATTAPSPNGSARSAPRAPCVPCPPAKSNGRVRCEHPCAFPSCGLGCVAARTSLASRIAVFAYGVASYAVCLVTFVYLFGFMIGFGVPTALDGEPQGPLWRALLVNLGLVALFGVQHSVMARPWFKRALTRIIPSAAERPTYVLLSCVALVAMFWLWRPIGGDIWRVDNRPAALALVALFAAGGGLVFVATFLINHFDLFGLRQVWLFLRGRPYTQLKFGTPAIYKYVRHPLYVGWIITFWATPHMTIAHLVFALGMTAYILLAIKWEERDLVSVHGSDYIEYRKNVPMLTPRLGRRSAARPQVRAS